MAKPQTEALGIPIENMIAQANAQALERKEVEILAPTAQELATLDAMPRNDIIALVTRICGARWGEVAMMTDDQAYEAVCLKMLHGGLTQPDMFKALPSLKEWADRRKGKPAQSIALTVEDKPLAKMSTDRLLALEARMARVLGEEAVLILPEPEKLVD